MCLRIAVLKDCVISKSNTTEFLFPSSLHPIFQNLQFFLLASALVALAAADKPAPEPAPYAPPQAYRPAPYQPAYKPASYEPAYKEPAPVPANYAFSYGVEDQ